MAVVTSVREVTRDAAGRVWRSQALLWLLPFAVFYVVQTQPQSLIRLAIAAPLAIGIVLAVARDPVRGFVVIVALVPFHVWMFSALHKVGAPAELLRPLAYWKELIAAGIVLAALRKVRNGGWRLDGLDWAALIYLAVVAAYLVFPRLLVPANDWYVLGAPTDRTVRLTAARNDGMFVVLLLALRHLRLAPAALERIGRAILGMGVVVAAIAIFEFLATPLFDRIVLDVLSIRDYQFSVLGLWTPPEASIHQFGYVGGQTFLRVGSVLGSALSLAFVLVLPFAVAVERLTRRADPRALVSVAVIGGALILTQTRSAVLAALVVAFLGTRKLTGRNQTARVQFMLAAVALLVIAVPVAGSTGLTDRVSAAAAGTDDSTATHWDSTYGGFQILVGQPWGRGLGTAPGIGQRFSIDGQYTSENYYLQVGNEIGVIGMLAFIGLVVAACRWALRSARDGGVSVLPAAASAALVGLSIGALLLHVWNDLATSWMVWGAVGAVIGSSDAARLSARTLDSAGREREPLGV